MPPDVRDFFQHEIDRAKKATTDRARERLRREKSAAEGNYPGDEEDEEAQVKRAIDLSRAEAEFRRGVEQRGGAYERGGGSGSMRGNAMQRLLVVVVVLVVFVSQVYIAHTNTHIFLTMSIDY